MHSTVCTVQSTPYIGLQSIDRPSLGIAMDRVMTGPVLWGMELDESTVKIYFLFAVLMSVPKRLI